MLILSGCAVCTYMFSFLVGRAQHPLSRKSEGVRGCQRILSLPPYNPLQQERARKRTLTGPRARVNEYILEYTIRGGKCAAALHAASEIGRAHV